MDASMISTTQSSITEYEGFELAEKGIKPTTSNNQYFLSKAPLLWPNCPLFLTVRPPTFALVL